MYSPANTTYPHAETSTAPPASVTPTITDITATAVIPPITLHTGAMGNHLFPAKVSSPRTQTLLRPFILKCKLAHHPDKAFVQQLISNIVHGCAIGYKDLTSQLMLNILVQL